MREDGVHQLFLGGLQSFGNAVTLDQLGHLGPDHMGAQHFPCGRIKDRLDQAFRFSKRNGFAIPGERKTPNFDLVPGLFRLRFCQTDRGDLRVAIGAAGDTALVHRVKTFFTGDLAHDNDPLMRRLMGEPGCPGHVANGPDAWFAGRADEIIKISAHRLGTIEVETAFLKHAAVAEAGVTGRPDELRGEVISAFIALKDGHEPSDELRKELLTTIREDLGPIAVVGELNFVKSLPKTRSGKIMRRVFKAVTLGSDPGDITTIEDEGSVEEAREAWQTMRADLDSSG